MSGSAPRDACSRCIMRRQDDPRIDFDAAGVCSHCHGYDAFARTQRHRHREPLPAVVARIKAAGQGREYDCVLGISGGVDSSYAAWIARREGLRVLGVHLDNGWNSELAVGNIERLCKTLDIDLVTVVIAWNEFRDLQLAYFRAGVVDIEAITDHAIAATLFRTAHQHRVRYILSGENTATEGVLPSHWVHNKNDLTNIRDIHRRHGRVPLATFPTLGVVRKAWYVHAERLRVVPILDYVDYVKSEAKATLARELGWRDYGGKHYESVFTRFYQAYVLPTKFGIDKRRAHLSTLVCSGQMTREQALAEVAQPAYDPLLLAREKEFVAGKLGLSEAEFDALLSGPVRSHLDFASHVSRVGRLRPLVRAARRIRSAVRSRAGRLG